jgi:hypothetical protein
MAIYHYWYGTVTYDTPDHITTRGTIIRARNLNNARKSLDSKIKRYKDKYPYINNETRRLTRIKKYDLSYGALKEIRTGLELFDLDDLNIEA